MSADNPSLDWYEANAGRYADRTLHTDRTHLYRRFLAHVPAGGRICDAGCGSGRDAAAFAADGYVVTAFDGAAAMATLARERTGLPVRQLRFEDVDYEDAFDGVWACASLLHLRRDALPDAVARLARALRPGGVLFMGFKHGDDERFDAGRWFRFMSPDTLRTCVSGCDALELIETWISSDTRPGRTHERWCNGLARRREAI